MKKFNKDNLKEVINKQFEINWYEYTFEEAQKNPNWFTEFTTTEEKEKEFIDYLRKYLKWYIPSMFIEKEISMFILNYWLKRNDTEINI